MGDFLVKIHINKTNPNIRKIETDQLIFQGSLPHCRLSHCSGLSLSQDRGGAGTKLMGSSPKTGPNPVSSSPPPGPCHTEGVSEITDSAASASTFFDCKELDTLTEVK